LPLLKHTGDEPLVEHHTPGRPGIDPVVEFFADRGLTAAGMLKCIALVDAEAQPAVVLVPGDRQARIPAGARPFEDADFAAHPHLVKGYIGPMGLQERGVRVLADNRVQAQGSWVTGANQPDHHVTGATLGRDFTVDEWGSFAAVEGNDNCVRCTSGQLELVRAVEAGHTFQLGLRYSPTYWMGCYGIGVSRLMAVVAEAHHDENGLAWPAEVAPYQVHLLAVGAARNPDVTTAADRLYDELNTAGVPTLYDDRGLSPGVTFADADLLGIPLQLIVGAKGLARGVVETKDRATGERSEIPADQAVYFSVQFLSTG
jgi:prolyl-tRNA synthetase